MFVGTQLNPEYAFEKGIEATLDEMLEEGRVNTVIAYANSCQLYQYWKAPKRHPETEEPYPFVWVRTDQANFTETTLRFPDESGARFGNRDILSELIEAAAPRGMQIYGRMLEPYVVTDLIENMDQVAQVDAFGDVGAHVCHNHPDYRAWTRAIVEDVFRNHPGLAGFKYGQERGGPINEGLNGKAPACFCEHCEARARERGIAVDRARDGLRELHRYARAIGEGEPPPHDGYFISLMRIYTDYGAIAAHTDWISLAVYFDCMGPRSHGHFNRFFHGKIFRDLDRLDAYRTFLQILGYDPAREPELAAQDKAPRPFSEEYVYSETKRAVDGAAGAYPVYARVGFDLGMHDLDTRTDQVYRAVTRALEAGADGICIAREWDDPDKSANRIAAGNAIRDWESRFPK